MENMRLWWNGRAPRERALLLVMVALMVMALAFGAYRWSENALRRAATMNLEAVERRAETARKIAWLQQVKRHPVSAGGAGSSLDQRISQSAGEAGFTLDRVQAQGTDQVDITIGTARSVALLGWLAVLEGQGIAVDKAMVAPSGSTGTVSAQLTLRRGGA